MPTGFSMHLCLMSDQLLYSKWVIFSVLHLNVRYDGHVMAQNTHCSLFPISHLCVLTHITWKLQVIYGHSAYQTSALVLKTFPLQIRVALEIQLESYGPRHISVILWYNITCVYCKPIHTSLFWCATMHDNKTHVPYVNLRQQNSRTLCTAINWWRLIIQSKKGLLLGSAERD